MLRWAALLSGWLALACWPAWGEPELSFGRVLSAVDSQHPALRAARLRREAAAAWERGAGAQPNPQVRLSAVTGDPNEESNELVQRLEIGGQPGLRARIAELQREQADLRILEAERALGKEAAQAYYGLWSAQEVERLQTTRFELADKLRLAAERRLKLGAISDSLYWRAELERSQAEAQLAAARSARKIAESRLNLLLQRPLDAEVRFPPAEEPGGPEPSREALLAAVDGRPEVRLAVLSAEIHRQEADLAGRQRVPDFELGAFRSSLGARAEQGLRVSLAFPLWDWGQVGAQEEQRQHEAEAAEQDALAQRQLATQEAVTAWESYAGQRSRRDILRGQVERFARQAELSSRGFEAGLLNLTEVFEAQRAYREALTDFVSAQSELHQRRWEVHWLSGGALRP